METYLYEGNVQRGPFELTEVQSLAANGRISKEALYWQPGMDSWKPLSTLNVFRPLPPSPKNAPVIDIQADALRIYRIAYYQRMFWLSLLLCALEYAANATMVVGSTTSRNSIPTWAEISATVLCIILIPVPFYLLWCFMRLRFLLYSQVVAIVALVICFIPFVLIGEMIFTGIRIRRAYRFECVSYNFFGFPSSSTFKSLKPTKSS